MPLPQGMVIRGTRRWTASAALLLAVLLAAGCVSSATILCVLFATGRIASPLLMPSAVLLAACGTVQGYWLFREWQTGPRNRASQRVICASYWQRLLSGAAILYVLALLIGPVAGIGWAWLAVVALWQTLLLLPLAAPPKVVSDWQRWIEIHRPKRLNWLVAASVLLVVAGEGSLRSARVLSGWRRTAVPSSPVKKPQASAAVLDVGPFVLSLDRLEHGRFRVAVLGETAHESAELRELTESIQQVVPGAEIVPLATSLATGRTRPGKLREEVEEVHADLVLAIVPACEAWAPAAAPRSLFDWRRFEVATLLFGADPTSEPGPARPRPADYESYLGVLRPQLAACRTPLNDSMRTRWEQTFATVDEAVVICRDLDVPLALVVVPAELQLNGGLRSTLLRRSGLAAEQCDVELPQRQLTLFAEQRALPLVDLLPPLRQCREPVYERHATALSDEGQLAAAAAIGGWLEARYGSQLAAQLSKAK